MIAVYTSNKERIFVSYMLEGVLQPEPEVDRASLGSREQQDSVQRPNMLRMQAKSKHGEKGGKKILSVQEGNDLPLNGVCVYILRSSSKRALGEETFQREIILGKTRIPYNSSSFVLNDIRLTGWKAA